MRRYELADEQWELIADLFRPSKAMAGLGVAIVRWSMPCSGFSMRARLGGICPTAMAPGRQRTTDSTSGTKMERSTPFWNG